MQPRKNNSQEVYNVYRMRLLLFIPTCEKAEKLKFLYYKIKIYRIIYFNQNENYRILYHIQMKQFYTVGEILKRNIQY